MSIESKITSKGQTTIPVEIRERLGLRTGDRIVFVETDRGFLLLPRNKPASRFFGALSKYARPGTLLEDYDGAIGMGISDHVQGRDNGKAS